ncbi:MAG: hypothetical protein JNK11_19670 [Alphaproteobacteria bacterium]|nr:hypothetical protein [Alphaproteobacteria bacterium]
MPVEAGNLVLRAMDANLGRVIAVQVETKARLSSLAIAIAGLQRDVAAPSVTDARIVARLDRMNDRLDRIERRQDLAEVPAR